MNYPLIPIEIPYTYTYEDPHKLRNFIVDVLVERESKIYSIILTRLEKNDILL